MGKRRFMRALLCCRAAALCWQSNALYDSAATVWSDLALASSSSLMMLLSCFIGTLTKWLYHCPVLWQAHHCASATLLPGMSFCWLNVLTFGTTHLAQQHQQVLLLRLQRARNQQQPARAVGWESATKLWNVVVALAPPCVLLIVRSACRGAGKLLRLLLSCYLS